MYYDKEKILEDINIFEYVKDMGIPYYSNGRTVSIHCPCHSEVLGKEDKNFGNCILTSSGKGFFCFACQKGGSIIDLSQHLYGYNYTEALASLASYLGDPSLYTEDGTFLSEIRMPFPFTNEELETIGLQQRVTVRCPVNEYYSKADVPSGLKAEPSFIGEEPTYTGVRETIENPLYDLFIEDAQTFYDMVFLKTIETMEDLRITCYLNDIVDITNDKRIMQGFEHFALEQFNICKGILAKFQFPCNVEMTLHHQQRISRFSA